MTGSHLIWVLVPLVVVIFAFEFLVGFGAYLADKSKEERNDSHVLRRAAWFGFAMVVLAILGSVVLNGLFAR